MKPTIRITVSGSREAGEIADALHCLNGSQSSINISEIARLFGQHEIAVDWENTPTAPVPVPLGPNVTRGGLPARVICNDKDGNLLVSLIRLPDIETARYHEPDGRVIGASGKDNDFDLVGHLPPEPAKPRECYVFVDDVDGTMEDGLMTVEKPGNPQYKLFREVQP